MSTLDIKGAYHDTPNVTPEREAAWEQWIQEYAVNCAQGWMLKDGVSRADALDGAAAIYCDLDSYKTLPWMPLGHALVERLGATLFGGGKQLDGENRARYINATRTIVTATEAQHIAASSYHLGLSPLETEKLVRRAERAARAPRGKGVTCLYRHYDRDGLLLYVGISDNPASRSEQHRANSKWYRFVVDSTEEWFDSRATADLAERAAIETERPLFNDTHNRANRAAAIDYLLDALDVAAA